jgi:hypothetical protein
LRAPPAIFWPILRKTVPHGTGKSCLVHVQHIWVRGNPGGAGSYRRGDPWRARRTADQTVRPADVFGDRWTLTGYPAPRADQEAPRRRPGRCAPG